MKVNNKTVNPTSKTHRYRVYVLNVYTLKHILNYITQKNKYQEANPFINALVMCDDNTTDSIIEFRKTIYPICKIDLGYAFGFNKTALSFDNVKDYNNNIKLLQKNIKDDIISLTDNMLNYIKLRKHVYIDNIVKFKNQNEQNNNIEQFLNYYNEFKRNRRQNINSSLKYMDITSEEKMIDIPIKHIQLDALPLTDSSNSFLENLFIAVLNELLKETEEFKNSGAISPLNYILKEPIYKNYKNFIHDYRLTKDENFSSTNIHTTNIVKYFTDLTWRLTLGKYFSDSSTLHETGNQWFKNVLNNEEFVNIEKTILQKLLLKFVKEKQVIHTSINSEFYNNIKANAKLFEIFQQLFIYMNYGSNIYGLY